jgi:Arc/MetJ family transcription regulator
MNTRTNIVLDDELIAKAMARAQVSTKKAAVEAALRAFVRAPDYSALLALQGSGAIADDYDPDEAYINGWDQPAQVKPKSVLAGNQRQLTPPQTKQRTRRKPRPISA